MSHQPLQQAVASMWSPMGSLPSSPLPGPQQQGFDDRNYCDAFRYTLMCNIVNTMLDVMTVPIPTADIELLLPCLYCQWTQGPQATKFPLCYSKLISPEMHCLGNFAHLPSALHHSCPLLHLSHPWPCPHQVLCPNHHIIQAIIRLWQRCVIYIKTELICDKLQVNNHKHYFHCKREDSSLPCLQRPLTQVKQE